MNKNLKSRAQVKIEYSLVSNDSAGIVHIEYLKNKSREYLDVCATGNKASQEMHQKRQEAIHQKKDPPQYRFERKDDGTCISINELEKLVASGVIEAIKEDSKFPTELKSKIEGFE